MGETSRLLNPPGVNFASISDDYLELDADLALLLPAIPSGNCDTIDTTCISYITPTLYSFHRRIFHLDFDHAQRSPPEFPGRLGQRAGPHVLAPTRQSHQPDNQETRRESSHERKAPNVLIKATALDTEGEVSQNRAPEKVDDVTRQNNLIQESQTSTTPVMGIYLSLSLLTFCLPSIVASFPYVAAYLPYIAAAACVPSYLPSLVLAICYFVFHRWPATGLVH